MELGGDRQSEGAERLEDDVRGKISDLTEFDVERDRADEAVPGARAFDFLGQPRNLWVALMFMLILVLALIVVMRSDDSGGELEEATPGQEAAQPAEAATSGDLGLAGAETPPEDEAGEAAAGSEAGHEAPPSDPEAAQLIASAAGVYQLQEASVRPLVESDGTVRFESAKGAIVIETNGEVAGDFNYVMWPLRQCDCPNHRGRHYRPECCANPLSNRPGTRLRGHRCRVLPHRAVPSTSGRG